MQLYQKENEMLLPKVYNDIRDIVTESIFSYDPKDIISVLTCECSIGPIIPLEHVEMLELYPALLHVKMNKDFDLLEEIHSILSEYINPLLEFFYQAAMFNEEINYINVNDFDNKYLWAEKYLFEMFNICSPRMIASYNSDYNGEKILYHELEGNRYTLCPMLDSEINMKKCLSCPFCLKIEEKYRNSENFKVRYNCKYNEFLKEGEEEYEF